MIDRKIVELVNRETDGRTTPIESAQLREILESNPEVRELFADLQRLNEDISAVRPVEPPPTLKPGIMRAIDALPTHSRQPKSTLFSLCDLVRDTVTRRVGIAFTGGMAVGLVVYVLAASLFITPVVRDADVAGTLLFHAAAGTLVPGETVDILRGGVVGGSVTTLGGKGLSLLRISLSGPEALSAELSYDSSALRVEALRPAAEGDSRIVTREGGIGFENRDGGAIDVLFAAKGQILPPVRIRISMQGKLIFDRSVALEGTKSE